MAFNSTNVKSLTPYLALSGICLAIYGGIQIHTAISVSIMSGYITYTEGLIGTIAFYMGLAAMLIIFIIIGLNYPTRKSETNTAIVLLILFISSELFVSYVPGIDSWLGGWGAMIVLMLYGIIRGLAFQRSHRALNVPKPGYANKAFNLYGWSFIVTTILSFILLFSGMYSGNYALAEAGTWVLIVQFYIDGLGLGIIGIKFIVDAFQKGKIHPSGIQPATQIPQQDVYTPAASTTTYTPPTTTEEESVLKYCTYCGAQNFDGGAYCENCGQKLG